MEKVLNDHFDPIQRRIVITDGLYVDAPLFYEPADNQPVRFDDGAAVYTYEVENVVVAVDFDVVVPNRLLLTEGESARFEAMIRKYALPDKTFKVREL